MGDRTLYDEDILIWSEQQAAALRSLASRRDLPNELDLANVIEEIEDVGRSEFHTVESLIENILTHLVLLAPIPTHRRRGAGSRRSRHGTSRSGGGSRPSMRARLDMDVAVARLAGGRGREAGWLERRQGRGAWPGCRGTPCPFTATTVPSAGDFGVLDAAAPHSDRVTAATRR